MARLFNYGEHSDFAGDYTPSITNAWDAEVSYGIFDLPRQGTLVTFVWLKGNDQNLEVGFDFLNKEGEWSLVKELELGAEWTTNDNGWRVTNKGLAELTSSTGEIDPTAIATLCRSAVAALKADLA